MDPRVSVIVRSYNRIPFLCGLLEKLLKQDHESFEIIVVEQSTEYEEKDWETLGLICEDDRISLLRYPPLGGPKARNEGVKNASGDILIFIDDDDLPLSESWITQHAQAYEDDSLVGFTGRHVTKKGESCPYLKPMRWFIRKRCMRYSWLKTPYTFAKFDEDVTDVDWLHGTNSSIRRKWALKAGLWDIHVTNQDEHSFAFKLQPLLGEDNRLDFRKSPKLLRRLDVEGGMGKREFSVRREYQNQMAYARDVLFKYHPEYKFLFIFIFGWSLIKVAAFSFKKLIPGF